MEESERPTKRMKSEHDTHKLQGEINELATAHENTKDQPKQPPTFQDHEGNPISKNAYKRLLKKQEWESKKDDRKAARKEKASTRKQRKRAEKAKLMEENGGVDPSLPPKTPLSEAVTLPVTILIDCDFDDLMRENERVSLAGQITRSYSENRKALFRAHLGIASYGGKLRERFESVLTHHRQWKNVQWCEEDFVGAAERARGWMGEKVVMKGSFEKYAGEDEGVLRERGEVVYLSSESDETLTELKPFSTYIVGGLVDRNREKGICFKRAKAKGVKTARLPIGDFMDMQSRKVLATNHVNEIMIRWLECGDWGEAFLKVIPKRKGGKLKGPADEAEKDDAQDDTQEESDMVEEEDGEQVPAEEAAVADMEKDDAGKHVNGES